MPDKNTLLVIANNPNPVEKLSKLTDKETKNILKIFNSNNFSSPFTKSINISTAIIRRIIPSKKLTFIFKNVTILDPNRLPNKGIIKCIIPTSPHKKSVLILLILNVPILRDIEKVSIDKDTPIINRDNITDTLSPYLNIFILFEFINYFISIKLIFYIG